MINSIQVIEQILKTSKSNKWPYPKTFEALEKAGVRSYTVNFINRYQALFHGDFGTYEALLLDYYPVEAAAPFSAQGIKSSIIKHTHEKSSYMEFLTEVAAFGVTHYAVDMPNRTVTYFNSDESQFHIENVPYWKE